MFENDSTGTLQGYFDRMHPTIRTIVEHMIEEPSAYLDPADMTIVWRGWVKSKVMEAIFGDVYDHEARPSDKNIYKFGSKAWIDRLPKKPEHVPGMAHQGSEFRYGTWARGCLLGLEDGELLNLDNLVELFRMGEAVVQFDGWGVVTEAMIMVVEGEGEVIVKFRIRGWRAVSKELH